MTRLDRILKLLDDYDTLAVALIFEAGHPEHYPCYLANLRAKKEELTKELIEHGCRRKN